VSFVLVAEANLGLANYAAETLTQAGFESRGADSQTEALAISLERRVDLVLTDYFLASGDGLGLIAALKESSPETAVALTTGLGDESLARAAFERGALDYVVKGRNYFAQLPALAESLIERHQKVLAKGDLGVQRCRLLAQVELSSWLDHNFKNILSAVMGSLALIDLNNPEQSQDKRREYLSDSLDSLRTAIKLLDSLTAMTKVVSQTEEGKPESVLVAAAVDEAWEKVTQALAKTGEPNVKAALARATFQNNCRWLSPQQVAYQDLLTILEALLTNAVEAVTQASAPRILVAVEKTGSVLRFQVSDNGRGMDAKVLRHAFEPLFSTKGQVGVGLSLTTVRALVDRHSGEINLSSTLGEGTKVVFTYHVGL
jgi:signal transduction histidine kinase